MKTLIAAIALSMAIATPVFADNHEMGAVVTEKKGDFFAADFIGKEIYTRETEWDENFFAKDGWETEWENIGQVENIILSQDGSVRAVKLEVGGFLGIGSKHVAVPMSRLSFIRRDGEWDNSRKCRHTWSLPLRNAARCMIPRCNRTALKAVHH